MKRLTLAMMLALLLSGCAAMFQRPPIRLGMTQQEVAAAWGRPDHKTVSTSKWGTTEIWRYGEYYERGE